MPKQTEEKMPVDIIEKQLKTTFGAENFTPLLAEERAHRVPARPPFAGSAPRTFIADAEL